MFKAIDCCVNIMAIILLSLTIALNIIFRNDVAIGLSFFFILIPTVGILLPVKPSVCDDDDTARASIIYMILCLIIEVVVTFW